MKYISADLHLHSVLSPCAGREMLPSPVIWQAKDLGLQVIAVTDHNTSENAAAFRKAAEELDVLVLPGMEVQTREEVHMVCLFDDLEQASSWQEIVYAHLPKRANDERVFGEQWVVDADDEICRHHEQLFLVSTHLGVADVVRGVRELGGLCFPAHVDRPAYSIIANLGFIPPDLELVAAEISQLAAPQEARARFPQLRGLSLVANSDAHYLRDMCKRNTFKVEEPTVAELALALAGRDGREVWIDGLRI